VEPGRRELRSQSHVANGAIAEDPATQARAAHRPCKAEVTAGDADKSIAGSVEPRHGDTRATARERTGAVPHGADARPAQGTHSKSRSRAAAGDARSPDASAGTADVGTKATDTPAGATADTADMTDTTAAAAETPDVTAAKAANATAGASAKTPDVTAAKTPAASSATATATTTTAGIGCDGDEGHHEEQHRGNGDASLQHRLRVTDIE
jgi:hypothetical protein